MPRQLKSKDVPKLRKWMLKKQKGKCLICGKKAVRPCLDHHHKKKIKGTGLIRGVLCSTCNVFLAKVENNCVRCGIKTKNLPRVIKRMGRYLSKKHYPYIHPTEKPKDKALGKISFKKLKKLHDERYPRRKPLEYPKSQKITVPLTKLFDEFDIEPNFVILKKKKRVKKKKKLKKKKGR